MNHRGGHRECFITLHEAKTYLRVDSSDEDMLIDALLHSAILLCADVARLTDEERATLFVETTHTAISEVMRVAVLYALAYLYEHREEADHHDLVITLRCLLFALREGVF